MPTTTTNLPSRTFGIEIEAIGISRQIAATAIRTAGVEAVVEGYNHVIRRHWKVVTDASVSRGGFEVVSPVLSGEAGIDEMRRVVQALAVAGARVDRSCGLHVHVGVADLTGSEVASIVQRYARFETEIDSFMPLSRRANANCYCRSVTNWARRIERMVHSESTVSVSNVASLQEFRSRKVNLECYSRQQTIEFRQHNGTCNASKIENWVRFCLYFVNASRSTAIVTASARPATRRPRSNSMDVKLDAVLSAMRENLLGLTVAEIAELGGWSTSSVPVYVSRLRTERGARITKVRWSGRYRLLSGGTLSAENGTGARRVARSVTLTVNDSLYREIPGDVVGYYAERTQEMSGSA